MPICMAVALGRGEAEASAHTAAALSTSITPLGQALWIQNQPSSSITTAVRRPAISEAVRLVFGSNCSIQRSRSCVSLASDA